MRIEKWIHTGVKKNGVVKGGGAVNVKGAVRMSKGEGCCGFETCHCSDGYWIMISMPRTSKGIVEGITVFFDDKIEMKTFFINHNIEG